MFSYSLAEFKPAAVRVLKHTQSGEARAVGLPKGDKKGAVSYRLGDRGLQIIHLEIEAGIGNRPLRN